jgi:hypothetical protein
MRNKNLLVKIIHNSEELNLHDVFKSVYKYAKKEKIQPLMLKNMVMF